MLMPLRLSLPRRSLLASLVLIVLSALTFSILAPQTAHAAGFTVNTTVDSDDGSCGTPCSLRDAITAANASPGSTITFDTTVFATPQTITLGSDLPTISANVTITGPGAALVTIDGNHAYQPFLIIGGMTVSMSGLTIANGKSDNGGGVANSGTLTVSDSTFSGNSATIGGDCIYSDGTLTVSDSTFSGNSATVLGGGIENSSGTATVINS